MKQADLPERHAIEVLLRGLKRDVTVNIETMNSGFHKEKNAFLEIVNILKFFAQKLPLVLFHTIMMI